MRDMNGRRSRRERREPEAWARRLLAWFQRNRRAMPWRTDPRPYRVWISEVMLQQTQVQTVIPYYRRFVSRFPTLAALAEADLQDVLKVWEGLGYYARARALHRAAGIVAREFGGRLPSDPSLLLALPGVGPYTAAAIASIGYGLPVAAVDGNVMRVMSRFRGLEGDIRGPRMKRTVQSALQVSILHADPSRFNQGLMELGALVCKPRAPRCAVCPLRRDCVALATGRTADLPARARRRRIPHFEIAAGIVHSRGRLLIARRRPDQMLGGLWEFPGGKRRPGETLAAAARREVREETGVAVRVGPLCATVRHAYSHFRITLSAFRCDHVAGRATARSGDAVRWVRPRDLARYPMPAANRKILEAMAPA